LRDWYDGADVTTKNMIRTKKKGNVFWKALNKRYVDGGSPEDVPSPAKVGSSWPSMWGRERRLLRTDEDKGEEEDA
jgi:hypothetical protein